MSFNMLPCAILLILLLQSSFTKESLAKLKPGNVMMRCIGGYVICATILNYISDGFIYWDLLQCITAISLIGYANGSKQEIPSWKIGRRWLISVIFALPGNVLWNWSRLMQPPSSFLLTLSVSNLSLTLLVLPFRISIKLVAGTLLVIFYTMYSIGIDLLLASGSFLTFFMGLSLIFFFIFIVNYNKRALAGYRDHSHYLTKKIKERQIKEQVERQKGSVASSDLEAVRNHPNETQVVIDQTTKEVTQFIAYLDDRPLYKESLDLITNKFITLDVFLKQRARSKNQMILIPIEVSLDEFLRKLEIMLELERQERPIPKLFIEYKGDKLPEKIICDVNQMVNLLASVIFGIASLDPSKDRFVRIQLYSTCLKYESKVASDDKGIKDVRFPAIALVISNAAMPKETLPNVRSCYQDVTVGSEFGWHSVVQKKSEWTIEKRSIERIVRVHYGYLQFPSSHRRAILIVVPYNAAAVRDEMISRILPSDPSVTHREFKKSMVTLTDAYNNLCTVADMRTIVLDQLFLLVRRCCGFRRHASGQLFYIRALGIAQLVAEWVPHQPRLVCFSVLYGLVCDTGLPLSYVKANYSVDFYGFIESIVAVNRRQEMEPCGLYLGNRLKRIINRDQLFILCIKFAERLYDLRHAQDYIHLEEVKHMAQETLTIDIKLGKKYLNAKIVEELVEAATQALQLCEGIC